MRTAILYVFGIGTVFLMIGCARSPQVQKTNRAHLMADEPNMSDDSQCEPFTMKPSFSTGQGKSEHQKTSEVISSAEDEERNFRLTVELAELIYQFKEENNLSSEEMQQLMKGYTMGPAFSKAGLVTGKDINLNVDLDSGVNRFYIGRKDEFTTCKWVGKLRSKGELIVIQNGKVSDVIDIEQPSDSDEKTYPSLLFLHFTPDRVDFFNWEEGDGGYYKRFN